MLFDNNTKLVITLVVIVGLIYFLNRRKAVPNEGSVQMGSANAETTVPVATATNVPARCDSGHSSEMELSNFANEVLHSAALSDSIIDTPDEIVASGNHYNQDLIDPGFDELFNNDLTGNKNDCGEYQPNDFTTNSLANFNNESMLAGNNNTLGVGTNIYDMINQNYDNQLEYNAADLLPQEVNKDWFNTDFSHAQVKVDQDNLIVTDRYIIGINTVGNSLRNPSYDLRWAPSCPKITVSPWNQSTIEPDFNIRPIL